jgi:hypothetical protein
MDEGMFQICFFLFEMASYYFAQVDIKLLSPRDLLPQYSE